MTRLLLLSLIVVLNISSLVSQPWSIYLDESEDNFFKVQQAFNKYWEGKEIVRGEGWKQFKRWEYFFEQRTYPSGKIPNAFDLLNSYTNFKNQKNDRIQLQSLQSDWKE